MFFRSKSRDFDLPSVLNGCRQGKSRAQQSLLEHYYALARKLCLRYASSEMEAEEMVDDGFMKVFEKIKEYDQERAFEPWLSRIMINTAIDYFRKYGRKVEVADLDEAHKVPCDADQIAQLSAEEIMSLVQQLPPVYRMVFNLSVMEGYDHAEIGKLLNISESTSRSNLSKARAKLQFWINSLSRETVNQPQQTRHVFTRF